MSNYGHNDDSAERRDVEIALLQAMYPSELTWLQQRQELTYKSEAGGSLTIRVSDQYPTGSRPDLIQAFDADKDDIREIVRQKIDSLDLPIGEEILDSIVQAFDEVIRNHQVAVRDTAAASTSNKGSLDQQTHKTVIVWLHHLLNTNKRKLALNPSVSMDQISGVTKPGYPGVLVYTGVTQAVDAHVSELKNQRWQAFQVRLEEVGKSAWTFSHGSCIKEVESMSEVAQSILQDDRRQEFLEAVGIK